MYQVRDQFNLSNKCHVKVPVLSKKPIDAGASVGEFLPADVILLPLNKKVATGKVTSIAGWVFWAIFVYKMIDFFPRQ